MRSTAVCLPLISAGVLGLASFVWAQGCPQEGCGNPNGACHRAWGSCDGGVQNCVTVWDYSCDDESNNECNYGDTKACSGDGGGGDGGGCTPSCPKPCGQSDGCGGKCSGPKDGDGVCCDKEKHGKAKFSCADCGTECDGVAGDKPGGSGCFCGCPVSGVSE